MGIFDKLKGTVDIRSRKMIFILGGIVVLAVGYTYLSPAPTPVPVSRVAPPPTGVETVQGAEPVTPAYDNALSSYDKERLDIAKNANSSAIPTLRANTSDQRVPIIELDEPEPEAPQVELPEIKMPDPVTIAPNVIQPVANIPIVQAPKPVMNEEDISALLGDMNKLRKSYMPAEVVTFSSNEALLASAQESSAQSGPVVAAVNAANSEPQSKIKLPLAGTILYAEMVSRANSDNPGPVLARILQGEYAGATLIGTFSVAENALIIKFDKMTVRTSASGDEINETIAINTVAVDTKYIGTGLATKVDRHLFEKLAIGFTASFARGFGDMIANNGTTTVVTEGGTTINSRPKLSTEKQLYASGGEALGSVGDVLMDEFGNRPKTIIVDSGTALGVLFL